MKNYTVEVSVHWSVDVEAENKEDAELAAEQQITRRISQFADFELTVYEASGNDNENH